VQHGTTEKHMNVTSMTSRNRKNTPNFAFGDPSIKTTKTKQIKDVCENENESANPPTVLGLNVYFGKCQCIPCGEAAQTPALQFDCGF
jgi:hypothetical protein